MEPICFEESNVILDPPKGMTLEQCAVLPVFRYMEDNGEYHVISCWKLTKSELEQINKTGRIWLDVLGTTMAPVSIGTEKPFHT